MIYILHGEDSLASYNRLLELTQNLKGVEKIKLAKEHAREDFLELLFAQALFTKEKIIICEDFISLKKISPRDFSKVEDHTVIFWEKAKITHTPTVRNLKIEEFKFPPYLYQFLDSLRPHSKAFLGLVNNIDYKNINLIWHMINRFLLLILAKEGFSYQRAVEYVGKPMAAWQWEKIVGQSRQFEKGDLYKIYDSLLKVDFMKKQGQTDADYQTLLPLLLVRHLKVS